ncbi:MAG TPA: hypothetical protein VMD91_04410 [Candidatus Sulfotelmatobacter sp.]|nr:hypothetical protein [Candidatus Sulfotelmatobacter sp.]
MNYDLAKTWLSTTLPPRSAVVDFLYHPDAVFWADHHATTFLSEDLEHEVGQPAPGRTLLYDRTSPSCAMLLWRKVGKPSALADRYAALAAAADRIDAAVYSSVGEAMFGWGDPAAEVNLSLTVSADASYGKLLLRAMRTMNVAAIASLDEVRWRLERARREADEGLTIIRERIRMVHGEIAVTDVSPPNGVSVNRYTPYAIYPEARYSITLTRSESQVAKITAMRNPWREFASVDLGSLFRRYGGGGHQRVGSVVLREGDGRDPGAVLSELTEEIRLRDGEGSSSERMSA